MTKNNYQSRPNIFRNGEKYISVSEAAKKMYFSEKAVLYWIRQRSIEAFRSNGRWWILSASVSNFNQVIAARNKKRNRRKKNKKQKNKR